eukprot:TRINITY_DN5641_c0_g1_i2.p1 TRINITY_DN5641_c0_g1~~TRINITY_DN5641_c0_g1_i2.p1  ORF type:complete len:326 (-),score=21.81 TRINITY_DN5641_c0_g1_i2:131-1108(-)
MNSTSARLFPTTAIPYSVLLPWDFAWPTYNWAFYVLIVLSTVGIVLNLVALTILFSAQSKNVVESTEAKILVIMLVLSDFGGSLTVFVSSVGSLASSEWIGQYQGCKGFSFFVVFLGMSTLATLDLMAFHLLVRVTNFKKVVLPLGKIYVGIYGVDLIFSALVAIYPGDSRLYASGSTCIPTCDTPVFYVFMALFIIMLVIIVVVYVRIYSFYKRITQSTKRTDGKISEKKRKLLRRFSMFIGVTLVTYVPFGIEVVYIWISSLYVPPEFTIWVTFSVYLQNILNPMLYFYSNEAALKLLRFKLNMTSELPSQISATTAAHNCIF